MNQNHDSTVALGVGLAVFLLIAAVALAIYLFICYCCKVICQKTGRDPGVLIWIPIAQWIPLLQVAGLPVWMIILFFVPIANVLVHIIMWVKIFQARGKSGLLVLLLIFLPIVFFP